MQPKCVIHDTNLPWSVLIRPSKLIFFILLNNLIINNEHCLIFICYSVTETHQVAEAQLEKNAKLREAFGISEYFVDGSSFDPDRQAKEQLAKSVAIQEKERQKAIEREKEKEVDKEQAARYELVHTPSPEPAEKITKKKRRKRKERYVSFNFHFVYMLIK